MTIADTFREAGKSVLDFLFPPECPLCHEPAFEESSTYGLCAGCRRRLVPKRLMLCLGCGAPLGPFQLPAPICAYCHRDRFAFTQVWSLGKFEGELRKALLKAKSKQGELLTIALADLLFELFHEEWEREPPDIVIGVPHHWTEGLRTRHIASQTAAIRLAVRLNVRLGNRLLVKRRRTVRQAALVPTARRANLADAFGLRRGTAVAGRRILLVDDVLTTGTTAHRLASLLKRSGGAKDVRVCVFARGLGQ